MPHTLAVVVDEPDADQVRAIAQILKTSPERVSEFALKGMTIEQLGRLSPLGNPVPALKRCC